MTLRTRRSWKRLWPFATLPILAAPLADDAARLLNLGFYAGEVGYDVSAEAAYRRDLDLEHEYARAVAAAMERYEDETRGSFADAAENGDLVLRGVPSVGAPEREVPPPGPPLRSAVPEQTPACGVEVFREMVAGE